MNTTHTNTLDAECETMSAQTQEVAVDVPQHEPNREPPEPETIGLGQRLRDAREARQLSYEDVGRELKLPHTVIEALEDERYGSIGYGIFLRGYLTKYLQLLDLPTILATPVIEQHAKPPPLVTSTELSRPRYLFERYSGSALYLILTAVIVVPAVYLAMHAGLDSRFARIAPLDTPAPAPATSPTQHPVSSTRTAATGAATSVAGEQDNSPPMIASMTPFNAPTRDALNAAPKRPAAPIQSQTSTESAAAEVPAASGHTLRLSLDQPSWVEVVAAGGKQLEYSLLPAGTVRTYHSDSAIDVLLGNADGVSVRIDGTHRNLSAYRHGNVVRFHLSRGNWSLAPVQSIPSNG